MWDVVKPDEAVDFVVQHLAGGGDRSSVAKLLVDCAKIGGSNDNISVVVVFLDSHKKDVPVKDKCDNVSNLALTNVGQLVSFDDNITNSTENGNINSGNTDEKLPVQSGKLSPKSPKRSPEASPNAKDGNTLEEPSLPIACNKSAPPTTVT